MGKPRHVPEAVVIRFLRTKRDILANGCSSCYNEWDMDSFYEPDPTDLGKGRSAILSCSVQMAWEVRNG